jgi:hypothetical protein
LKEDEMEAIEDRGDDAGDPIEDGEEAGGQVQVGFATRQRELGALLGEVDTALRRCGIALRRRRPQGEVVAAVGPLPAACEEAAEPRTQVREVAAVMFSRLGSRLEMLSRSFGRLSEEERASLAALLRLAESRRGAIGALLCLSERERKELSRAFRLSDAECDALADLLDPVGAPAETRPTITIVDPDAVSDGAG